MEPVYFFLYESSLGYVVLVARGPALIELGLSQEAPHEIEKGLRTRYPLAGRDPGPFKEISHLVNRYLRGERVDFSSVRVDISSLGAFTQRVLAEARKIPYGEVRSYSWLARQIGSERACRAVGQAMGANPIPIIIPCHRVVRQDGSLGGFSMGLHVKRRLLAIEGVEI